MTRHTTGTREQWLAARLELLEEEKALTRRSDELARRRQALPWVRLDKTYRFETDAGSATLTAVSRAPLARLQAFKRRMGWVFPWASSIDSDFNFDFSVQFTQMQQREGGIEYNYRCEPAMPVPDEEASRPAIPTRTTPDGPPRPPPCAARTPPPTLASGRA